MKNDLSDPEIRVLMERVETYRKKNNFENSNIDRSKVEDLYKRDADFQAFDIAPPIGGYIGWDAYGEAWSKVLSKYSRVNFTFNDDLRVFRQGNVAWITVSSVWAGMSKEGAAFHKDMRLTLVWVREADGVWRVTHEHGSSPRTTELASGEIV